MKLKKSLLFLLGVFLLINMPSVEAAKFNDSTGGYTAPSASSFCPRCSWVWQGRAGFRLGLYKYNGNGNPIKCGESLELFNSDDTSRGGMVTSGHTRLDYLYGNATVEFNDSRIYGESIKKYNGGKTLWIDFSEPSKGIYVPPWGPPFIEKLSEYIGSDESKIKETINSMFGYANFNIAEAGQYYISVEPTLQFYNRKRSIYVYGTGYEVMSVRETLDDDHYTYESVTYVSEGKEVTKSGYTFWGGQAVSFEGLIYNAMFVEKNPLKIFNSSSGSYDQYNFVNHESSGKGLITASSGSTGRNTILDKYDDADFPYGITILWLNDIVGPPVRTCKNYCEGLDGSALNNCAEQYCKANEPTNADCEMECMDIVYDSPGCDREYLNVCYNGDLKTSDIKSEGNYCAASGETTDKTLTSKICYDDVSTTNNYKTESLFIRKGTNNVYVTETSKTASISYYKIECDEAITFTNLPARTTVHVSSSLTANLYAGYTMDYSKVCQIYYKTSDEKWTTDYSKSRVADEIKKYSNRSTKDEDKGYIQVAEELIKKEKEEIKDLEKKTNRTATEEAKLKTLKEDVTRLEGVITTLNEVVDDLKTIKPTAEARLKSVKDKDQGTSGLTNQIELEVSNESASSSTVYNITLEPVYCIANDDSTTEKYCDLETYKEYTVNTSNNNVTCTDKNKQEIKATVSGGKSTYTEKVYYSLPSSYTGINEVGATVVCHSKVCTEGLTSPIEIPSAWVFDPLSETVSIDAYNAATEYDDLKLTVKGMGSCGQFSYELNCGYDFASSKLCTEECIEKYNDPNSGMTEEEYQACFKKHCSCDSYCGSNVACRMKYCPQECEGCEDLDITENSCSEDSCIDSCNKTYTDHNDRLTCRYGCCRRGCNGEEGCIYNCCTSECDAKKANNYITADEYNLCIKMCSCENGSCPPDDSNGRDYIYRTINLKRPFPNGDNPDGRTPGANWFGKVEYITSGNDVNSKYYDATNGASEEYEYRFVLSAEKIKEIKANEELNLTYTEFKESKNARNTYEEKTKNKPENQKANVYCSYVIHDYFKNIGIEATSNAKDVDNKYVVGSGCYTR